jgi:hypothetical protein
MRCSCHYSCNQCNQLTRTHRHGCNSPSTPLAGPWARNLTVLDTRGEGASGLRPQEVHSWRVLGTPQCRCVQHSTAMHAACLPGLHCTRYLCSSTSRAPAQWHATYLLHACHEVTERQTTSLRACMIDAVIPPARSCCAPYVHPCKHAPCRAVRAHTQQRELVLVSGLMTHANAPVSCIFHNLFSPVAPLPV